MNINNNNSMKYYQAVRLYNHHACQYNTTCHLKHELSLNT